MIPAQITADLNNLIADVAASAPLASAPTATVLGLQGEALSLLTEIGAAIPIAAGQLDGPDPVGMPLVLAAALVGLVGSMQDQTTLVEMQGYTGRAYKNLLQVVS